MGTWISYQHLEIVAYPLKYSSSTTIYYQDIDDKKIEEIIRQPKIKYIQLNGIYGSFPLEVYGIVDRILEKREDMFFRIYGVMGDVPFDISPLQSMKHLHRLIINCHLRKRKDLIDFNVLPKLSLKALRLDAFDLRDYTFMKYLSEDLECLTIHADTMGPNIQFDCEWLLRYKKLHTLWLGKKAKKHITCLAQMPHLKSLTLRGIKLENFTFLKEMSLEKLELLWNANNDLCELKDLKTLKYIGLWRISRLENIDFISDLENLEVIKLQDLKHVTQLPDLTRLHKLKTIVLDNTGICIDEIEEPYHSMVEKYWRN